MDRFEDFKCSLTKEPCDRGALPDCPVQKFTLIEYCKWFTKAPLLEKSLSKVSR